MHHKKSELHQIRKQETTVTSTSYNQQHQIPLPYIQPNPSHNPNIQQQHHNQTQQRTHLRIQIPSLKDPNFEHEPISRNPSTPQKPILSTPHKRTLMTQSSKQHPFTQNSTKYNHHQQNLRKPNSFFFCLNLASIPFLTKSLASRVCCRVCRARIYGIHLRFIVLLILPTLYFFASNTPLSFMLEFICVVAFSIAFLTSLNLALPRLPSIKLFLSRSLPSKFTSLACGNAKSHNPPPPPVVWSIGSKPKTEKKLNSGFGVQVYSNGDVYEGEFHRGKCSGSGVYYYYRSGRYEGDWVDGKYDGYGVETWAKGSRYRGQYMQGLRHGIGVYRFYNGDVYAGEWSNGQSHGCGVHTCEDGSKYVGEFKWGVKHGLGHYHFRNGDTYAGEYFADKMHGFGVYQFGNGHRYEGAWHEGRRQGFGMYTFRNGERQCGHWQNGIVDVPSPRSVDAGSPTAVIHSKVLMAVQEARRAAERASEVGKIDDRVNKVIAAANKSANAARVAAVKAVQDRMFQNTSGGDLPMGFV